MSMRDYALNDYGVLLNGRIPDDVLEDMYDAGVVDYTSDFTGEAVKVNDDGSLDWGASIDFSEDSLYHVSVDCPLLFSAAYKDMDELVDDAKRRVDNAIGTRDVKPLTREETRDRIVMISGTYFG